ALVVALAFLWLLRRWDLWWRGMLTNLWPVLLMLAGMQWLGIAIDVGTVMVAALTLGIAVDDTLHTLGHYRSLEARHGPAAAARLSLRRTAPAYLLNALVLAAGFGVCALSDFRPTARFGGVTALGVLLALLADLVLLPALLALAGDRRKVVSSQAAPARRSEGPGA
ncbi:MAG: MMPL family transporter, partial [Polyangiales bacterium]